MDIKNIIVNASGAKMGGAETIIKTFIESIPDDSNRRYYIFTPVNVKGRDNIILKYKRTNGLGTIWFSFIGIVFWQLRLRAKTIISFNNINSILYSKKAITYFHQPKTLDDSYKEVKLKVYRFLIKNFLSKNHFVVQSCEIMKQFKKSFPKTKSVTSCWPGYLIPVPKKPSWYDDFLNINENNIKLAIFPVASDSEHKNVKLLNNLVDFFKENKIKVITALSNDNKILSDRKVFFNVGLIKREELFYLYDKADFLFFTSKAETVGLPIFEFLNTGKPAFVYQAPYIIDYYKQFMKPSNLIIYKDSQELEELLDNKEKNSINSSRDYSKGEWEKIFNII